MMKKEEIVKFYQHYRLYIFPAVVALSSLTLIIFVIYPQALKLITNKQVEGDMINRSKFLEVKAQALESLDSTDLNRKKDFALVSYPTDKDFASALGLLQNFTVKSGFNIVLISLGSGTLGTNAQSYNLKLDILGPQTLLPGLLSNIENSPRLMRVSSVETNLGKDPQGALISLSVDVLYSSVPEDFGSIDSPLPELSEKDEEVLVKLARSAVSPSLESITPSGARGKANPFE